MDELDELWGKPKGGLGDWEEEDNQRAFTPSLRKFRSNCFDLLLFLALPLNSEIGRAHV